MSRYPCGIGSCDRWFTLAGLGNHRRSHSADADSAASAPALASQSRFKADRAAGSRRSRASFEAACSTGDNDRGAESYGEGCGGYDDPDVIKSWGSDDDGLSLVSSVVPDGSDHDSSRSPGGAGSSGAPSLPSDSSSDGGDGRGSRPGLQRLDAFLVNPTELSNTILGSAGAECGLNRRQLDTIIRAVKHPGFNASLLFKAAALTRRVDLALEAYGADATTPYTRLAVPCEDLVLPVGAPAHPFVINFNIAQLVSDVLRSTHARHLVLDPVGAEPSHLPRGVPVEAGSACHSPCGRAMHGAILATHAAARKRVLPLLAFVALDESRASCFGNVMLFPVVLILLSLKRPFRHRKSAMSVIAYLPVVGASGDDSGEARAGAAELLQRALRLAVVHPLQELFRDGFVVKGIRGLEPVLAVIGVHAVGSDHVGLAAAAGVNRNACIECPSTRGAVDFLDPDTALHPRRTIAASTAARAAAAAAPTKAAAAQCLALLALRAGPPCAFDEWTLPGGMWAGCPYGISARSALCLLHHFRLGYCKYLAQGFDAVFGKCANFTSSASWREAKSALARFIESQPSFDAGVTGGRLVSLGNWSDITWWSGDAVFSSVVMTTAALQALHWPFEDRALQGRLISVGVQTLRACALSSALQQPVGGGVALQECIESMHAAFSAVEGEFEFSISERNKPHNAVVHMVSAEARLGKMAEFDGALGIEAVHPRGKAFYNRSNHKGEVQEVVATALTREVFAMTALSEALERARLRLEPAAGGAAGAARHDPSDSDDEADAGGSDDDDGASGTCAYATGALVPDMRVLSLAGQLPQLLPLLSALFPRYCSEHHGAVQAASPLARPLEQFRCSLRRSLRLRRDGMYSRTLPVVPSCMVGDPYSALRPCVQLFRDDSHGGLEPDPGAFCELLLVLSYDMRDQSTVALKRQSERELRSSDAEDMVLVRRLKRIPARCNDAFSSFLVPGPPLCDVVSVDFKHFELLPLSVLARARAVFPAQSKASAIVSDLPDGILSPWSCQAVSVFMF
jgi:hypothetical protein